MTDEEFKAYHDGRYKEELNYYDRKANHNRRCYHVTSVYVLAVSITITPILTVEALKDIGAVVAALLAPTVALVAGIAAHFRFHENWLSFRKTWDALRHEAPWREAKIGDYKDAVDVNALFVERVEALISSEGQEWLQRHAKSDATKSSSGSKQ